MKDLKISISQTPSDLVVNFEVFVEIKGKHFDCNLRAEYYLTVLKEWVLDDVTAGMQELVPEGYNQREIEEAVEKQAKETLPKELNLIAFERWRLKN